jgi:hypothetical protein
MMKTFEEVFNEEERKVVDDCIFEGKFDSVPSALESYSTVELTPEREAALQAYLDSKRPDDVSFDSGVRAELQKKENEEGFRIETPEEEKEWQDKIDAEAAAHRGDAKDDIIPAITVSASDEDADAAPLTRNEIMKKLKEKGVSFSITKSRDQLAALLEEPKV